MKFNPESNENLQFVHELLRQAGHIGLNRQSEADFQLKQDNSIVTHVDHAIESFLISEIQKTHPDHRVISEERGVIEGDESYTWIIDPLDGTRVYHGGLPFWGICIGIIVNDQPRMGVVYLPRLNEMYVGAAGKAFLNGNKLVPVNPPDLESPVTFLAVPSECHSLFDVGLKRLRSFGSLAAHLAYVARGSAIGALSQHVGIWDIAAMMPILDATGIKTKYLSGKKFIFSDLISEPSMEPLVFAHPRVLTPICRRITMKKEQAIV